MKWGNTTDAAQQTPQAVTIDLTDGGPLVSVADAGPIPFLDLKTPHRELADEILDVWGAILKSGGFIGGPHVESFEQGLAEFVGTDYAVGVANGTDALTLALKALGVSRGDEVITAANTFFATVEAIMHAGGEPVLADVDPITATLSPEAFERAITPATKAVVPVHLYGQPADMDPIMEIAEHHGIAVLEDNAQALGASYRGRAAGSIGHAAATSFYPGKNLGATGDGGAVTTNDPDVVAKVRTLGNHGQAKKYQHVEVGYNSRLDALHAAALEIKLRYLNNWNDERRRAAAEYRFMLDGVELPEEAGDRTHVYHLFVVRHPDRDHLLESLQRRHIGCGMHYPDPIHLTQPFRHLGDGPGSFPVAERWASMGLSLPMFPTLTRRDVAVVSQAVSEALEEVHVLESRSA